MSLKIKLMTIIIIILLAACDNEKYEKLNLTNKKNEFIEKSSGDTILIGRVVNLIEYKNNGNNNLLVIDGMTRSILELTHNLDLVKYTGTDSYDFLFMGPLKSGTLYKNKLFLIDNSPQLKILNLNNNEIKKFELKYNDKNPTAFFNNLQFLDDSTFVISTVRGISKYEGEYARRYNLQGEYLNNFVMDINELEYNDFVRSKPNIERSYVSVTDNKVLISFKTSRMCLEYDINGKFLKKHKLKVDKRIYQEPYKGKNGIFVSPVCGAPLNIADDGIYNIAVSNPEGPNIFKYDKNFNLIQQYKVASPGNGSTYGCLKIGKQLFYYNRFDPDVYKCVFQ